MALAEATPGRKCIIMWNPQADSLPAEFTGWVDADRHCDVATLFRPGQKVNYLPHRDLRGARYELAAIVRYAMERYWPFPVIIIADEAHEHAPLSSQGSMLHTIAAQGGKQNVWGIFVTQRPQQLAMGIRGNCREHRIFPIPMAGPYFQDHGVPGQWLQLLEESPRYSYIKWDLGKISGPYHVDRKGTERLVGSSERAHDRREIDARHRPGKNARNGNRRQGDERSGSRR